MYRSKNLLTVPGCLWLLTAAWLICPAQGLAQYTWNGPVYGGWNNAANWLPVGVPNGAGVAATLGAAQGGYPCVAGGSGMSSIGTLQLDGGTQLTGDVQTGNTNVINNGVIRIVAWHDNDIQRWVISGQTTLSGVGEVAIGHSGYSDFVGLEIHAYAGSSLTVGPNQLIHGAGDLAGHFDNQGTIISDELGDHMGINTTDGAWTNSGIIKATNSGDIGIIGPNPIVQVGVGQIVADGGIVYLSAQLGNITIVGGKLDGRSPSYISWSSGTLDGVTNVGLLRTGNTSKLIGSTMTNNGTIQNPYTLAVNSNVLLTGTGLLQMYCGASELRSDNGSTLTLDTQQTLRGEGSIRLRLINNGTITTDSSNGCGLILQESSKTNNSLISATNAGTLGLYVDVDGTGHWLADNGIILLWNNVHVSTTGAIEIKNNGRLKMENTGATMTGSHLTMDATGYLTVLWSNSSLTLSGNVDFAMTDEARWYWESGATLKMTGGVSAACGGPAWARLEAGGMDKGAAIAGGGYSNNFDLANLTLDAGAHVVMVDSRNNGNRGSLGFEVVYADAVTMNAGSVLNLNGLRLYVNGAQVLPGPRGSGTVVDCVLCNSALGDMNCDAVTNLLDVPNFVQALLDPVGFQNSNPGCSLGNADMNGDCQVNGLDVQRFVLSLI